MPPPSTQNLPFFFATYDPDTGDYFEDSMDYAYYGTVAVPASISGVPFAYDANVAMNTFQPDVNEEILALAAATMADEAAQKERSETREASGGDIGVSDASFILWEISHADELGRSVTRRR